MTVQGSKLVKPISVDSDIPRILGISSKDVGTQQMSNAINKFSYYKPVNSPEKGVLTMTDDLFRASLTPVYYYAVGESPANADWKYTKYQGPFRVLDFDGYDHGQYLIAVDIAGTLPSNIEFDNCRYAASIELGPGNLWPKILNLPAGVYYDWALILVCTKGGVRKVYRTGKEGWQTWSVGLFLGAPDYVNKSAYDKFKAIGIADYTVDIFAVVIPRNHPDKTDGFIELTGSANYMLLPQTTLNGKIYNPIKKGIRISNPKPRTFWEVSAYDLGNQTDGTYIPTDALIGGDLMGIRADGGGVDLWYEPNGIPFSEFIKGPGSGIGGVVASGSVVSSGVYTKMKGNLNIYYYEFRSGGLTRPVIVSYGAGGVVTEYSRNVNIKFDNLSMGTGGTTNSMTVSFYFVDPDFRPG